MGTPLSLQLTPRQPLLLSGSVNAVMTRRFFRGAQRTANVPRSLFTGIQPHKELWIDHKEEGVLGGTSEDFHSDPHR